MFSFLVSTNTISGRNSTDDDFTPPENPSIESSQSLIVRTEDTVIANKRWCLEEPVLPDHDKPEGYEHLIQHQMSSRRAGAECVSTCGNPDAITLDEDTETETRDSKCKIIMRNHEESAHSILLDAKRKKQEKESKCRWCWRHGWQKFVQCNPELEKEAEERYKSDTEWKMKRRRWTIENEARREVGRKHIAYILAESPEKLEGMVLSFTSFIKDDEDCLRIKPSRRKEVHLNIGDERETIALSGARRRRRWTVDEDRILQAGVEKKKGWANIASDIAAMLGTGRRGTDCRDRWRNIDKGAFTEVNQLRISTTPTIE